MPKPNAVYIYGLANEAITFFKGSAILDWNTRQVLLDFFTQIAKNEDNLNQKLAHLKNNFGFYPYIRKAYEHKKNKSTLFDFTGKQIIESYFSVKAIDRENEVIAFFQEMAKRAIN